MNKNDSYEKFMSDFTLDELKIIQKAINMQIETEVQFHKGTAVEMLIDVFPIFNLYNTIGKMIEIGRMIEESETAVHRNTEREVPLDMATQAAQARSGGS